MLPEPLADLDSLDLSRVIVSHQGVYGLLKQRGTFAVIDGILHHDIEDRLIIGFKDIRKGQPWGDDHIPGRPIFPGTLMVEDASVLWVEKAEWECVRWKLAQERPPVAFVAIIYLETDRYRDIGLDDIPPVTEN